MNKLRLLPGIHPFIFLGLLIFPLAVHASFIEATVGTAVVNDATATYHNPAALTLLKNPQIITLGSLAYLHSQFTGQFTQLGFTQSGNSNSRTHYFIPTFYLGLPTTNKVTVGLAVISNFFNKDLEGDSILRYSQSNNNVKNLDIDPGVGIKINEFFSLGGGLNFSYANFLLQPTSGFPSINVPDTQSRNECDGTGVGANVGFLLKPANSTFLGFNYHSSVTYKLSGKSILETTPEVISNNYYFNFWTPARSVLSINHFVTQRLGFIATAQYIQWSLFQDVRIHGIATQIGTQTVIANVNIPFRLHDAWLFTLGSHYRITPKCIIRVAGTYNQSPGNNHYQISNGDSYILGGSLSYEIFKNLIIDGSYAHAFIHDENININSSRSVVTGVNKAARDGVSLKLTFNL
ncbi:MAG: outer membrane protein transport protein [Gammaproteobacteria bacterium]|nr:outer membrane protein transport protein [Gammaproteobacteria bacterium]